MFPEIMARSLATPECFFPDSLQDADGQEIFRNVQIEDYFNADARRHHHRQRKKLKRAMQTTRTLMKRAKMRPRQNKGYRPHRRLRSEAPVAEPLGEMV